VRRREFITLLGGSAAWPLAARAQTERMRRIGVLMGYAEGDVEGQSYLAAFREGLQKLGWVEDRNTRFDARWATADDAEARQRFAKELVALQPDLILSNNTPTTAALLQQTRAIPIVFATVSDPVGASRSRAATSPVSRPRWARWLASGWSCSRRLRRASTGSPSYSTRRRRHMPRLT
jgi:putative tryptophan/tyrosine transport system substrate-binding protein